LGGLGVGLCEDDGSPGSDTYCNHGGWEAGGLAIAALGVVALVVPGIAAAAKTQRWFWIGVVSPLVLGVLVVVVSVTLGTD
jgi:hypothetical protein